MQVVQEKIWEPARKPLKQQYRKLNRFTCGKCQTTFTTRFAQSRHLGAYHTEEKKLKRQKAKELILERALRKKERERTLTAPQVPKKPRGRPPYPIHMCKKCDLICKTARKKRDHQSRCKPWRNRRLYQKVSTTQKISKLSKEELYIFLFVGNVMKFDLIQMEPTPQSPQNPDLLLAE